VTPRGTGNDYYRDHRTDSTDAVRQAADGVTYAYRRFGGASDVPLLMLQHFRGNIDNWDPAFIDVLAAEREVILVDYAGVSSSSGLPAHTVAETARQVIAFADAIGLARTDLLGFSLGGFVAQDVRSLIGLAGQYAAADETLTGRENLVMAGRLYRLGTKLAKARAEESLGSAARSEFGGHAEKKA